VRTAAEPEAARVAGPEVVTAVAEEEVVVGEAEEAATDFRARTSVIIRTKPGGGKPPPGFH